MKHNEVFRRGLLLVFLCTLQVKVFAQTTVTGKVTHAETGEVLPGVNVLVKGSSTGVATDQDGNYSITVPGSSDVLVYSFIGMATQEISVSGRKLINVSLVPDIGTLDQAVVVSYGTQREREITGSVQQLDAEQVKDMPVSNIGERMQGKLAGVQIGHNTGRPGAEMSFRIRGAASINAGNNPLVVIDGFPTESGLQTLSPNEIASITVLKDAAAASLYGSRAANGVILVTTKQAKDGQKKIEFSSYFGMQSVPDRGRPDLMNAREFAQFKKEFYEDAAKYEGYTGGVPDIYQHPEQYAPDDGTDWFDVLLQDALTQDYNLLLSSGTSDLKSVVNLNYNSQEGVILNSYSQRFTGRANNSYTVSDKLSLGMNLGFTYMNSQIIPGLDNGRNIIQSAYLMDPTLEYRLPDGTYPVSFSQPGMFPNPNYYLVATQRKNPVKNSTVLANAYATYNILDDLEYKVSVNVNTNNSINRSFTPSTAQGGLGGAPPQPPTGNYGTSQFLSWLAENTLTYRKTINGKHNIEAFAGYTVQKVSAENSNINGTQFPDDNIDWINAATIRIGDAGTDKWSLLSYIARLNYNYQSKYLLSLSFRRDGSSKFGRETKWGNFPAISAGWVVSDENFMKDSGLINFLKIRASYGEVGNNNIGNYTHLASVNPSNYVFDDQVTAGKALGGIGNAALTWETTKGYDIGLDLRIVDGRILFTYDYYKKITDGLLYGIDIPIQSGFSSITSNIGRFDFWGHEFSVNSENLTGSLKWNTNFNITFARSLVKKLGTNNTPIGAYGLYWDDNRTAVGHPIGMFYGYINDGVYMTQEEFETQPHGAASMVGTARFKDISGPEGVPDGVIDVNDRTFIGNPNPDFYYGLSNTLSYKNFDLSIVMGGSVGNDIADDAYQSTENLDGVFNVRKEVAERWRSEEDPGAGNIPRTRSGTTEDFRNFTSRQVFDGSYLAVKNIVLGYTIPLASNPVIKNARAYISTQNAFILTKYPGMNPEVSMNGLNGLSQGRDFTSYPVPFTLAAGINVTF